MKSPRVMLTVGSYDRQGGTNTFVRNLSDKLSKSDTYTLVLSHKLRGDSYKNRKINKNLDVAYFPAFLRIRYFIPIYIWRFFVMAIYTIHFSLKKRIDIILTGETEALPFLAARLVGVKVIIRGGTFPEMTKTKIAGTNIPFKGLFFFTIDLYEKIILLLSSKVVSLAEWEEESLKKYTNKKPVMIRYAVDTESFKPSKLKNNHLVYVGRITPLKKIDVLLEIFDEIRDRVKTKLYLVGPLEESESLKILTKKTKYKKDIVYLGEKKTEKISRILGENYIFIHTAPDLGNSPLEAASTGLPVVVLGKRFKEKYVMTTKDKKDFIEKTINLLKNKKTRDQISKDNRDYIMKNHSWEKITEQYNKLFREEI